jgi:hypothetical protein
MVPIKGFEPPTFALRKHCSTPELNRLKDVKLLYYYFLERKSNKPLI